MLGFFQRANIFLAGATGKTDALVKSSLRCRLTNPTSGINAGDGERAEYADTRRMLWEPGYIMPEDCQVEVSGVRYNVVDGTKDELYGPNGAVAYRRCRLIEAKDG